MVRIHRKEPIDLIIVMIFSPFYLCTAGIKDLRKVKDNIHDPESLDLWSDIITESKIYAKVYDCIFQIALNSCLVHWQTN